MKDMKIAQQAKKGETMLGAEAVEQDKPEYPYGLRISLDSETLNKLGMTELPAIDQEFKIMALACVVSVSQHESQSSDKPHKSVDLQIKMIELAAPGEKQGARKDPAELLYGK